MSIVDSSASNPLPASPPAKGDVIDLVRSLLTVRLDQPEGPDTVRGVSRQLGMSSRSLQRTLRAFGASYASILSEARRDMAQALLARGARVGDVARRLGYADQTAFSRAFRRWTGVSPRKYKDAHRAAAEQTEAVPQKEQFAHAL